MIYYWILSALFVHLPPLAACYSFYHSASRLVDIDAYCQADRPNSLKYGGNSRLLLRQVHIFTRHGDRTPLRGLQRETNISWAECNEREILHLTASDQVQDRDDLPPNGPSRKFERTVEIPDDDLVRRGYWSGNCNPGQLTTRGHRQLRQLGSSFRNLYLLDNSRWINNSTPTLNNHQISVRSTDVWRTIQSAQSFVSGLFQPESITPTNDFIIPLKVRPKNIDSLSVSITHCPRLMRFREESQQANIFKAFQGEMAKVNKFITEFTQSADFTLDQHYDSLQARYCHKKPLPCR